MIGLTNINRTADLTPSEPQSRAFTANKNVQNQAVSCQLILFKLSYKQTCCIFKMYKHRDRNKYT